MDILPNKDRKINPEGLFYVLTGLIIVGCTIGGYLIGRMSAGQVGVVLGTADHQVIIDTSLSDQFLAAEAEREALPKTVMASRNGTRYYTPGCVGGGSIAEENRIWFTSENEARMAGYSLAKACQ